jgi:hypothetical protein
MYRKRRISNFRRIALACAGGFLLLLGGCSYYDLDRPVRVPVSGKVLIDGKPLEYGFIRFIPSNARPSGGKIDRYGRFALSCFEDNDGAVPGLHKVAVVSCEPLSETEVIWHLPKKYGECATSGLEQRIDGPTDSVVINLTWDGGEPFLEVDPAVD